MKYCILLLVVATALGVPIIQDAEDVQCNSLFQYKKEYVFSYTGTTKTGIVGTHDITSDTRITCSNVVVSVPKKCLLVLSTKDCEITPATDQTRSLTKNLQLYDLMAYVQNGLITELQPHVEERIEVLNIKRGILSALQMEWTGSLQEELVSDQLSIHGNCSATTTHVHNADEYTEGFLVTRDLNSCSQKPVKTPLLWSGLSYLQNMNIGSKMINSSQQCRYETYNIKGQNMQKVECTEIHSFWPMSISSDRGIMTTITQVLEESDLRKLNTLVFDAQKYNTRSTNIIQEIPDVESHEELSVDEAMAYIRDLVKSTLDEVKMDTPRKFGNWVKALRSLNNDTIHEVFEKTYYCEEHADSCANTVGKPELAREYLWDGLIQCGTLPCFAVVNTAIIKNIIPKPLAHVMMYTMAFRDYPTLDIITEGVRLAQVNRTRSIFLPVSTMIYKYWVDHPEIHSERDLPVAMRTFIELLNNMINNDCSLASNTNSVEAVEEERQILLAIKSLGNLGPVAQKYDETEFSKKLHFERELINCAINDEISFNISLNAVQALRRFNMSTVSTTTLASLKEVFLDASLDVELRIAAYLIYMKSDVVASEFLDVYQSLKDEPVKQFKAFTFSHISNILQSEDPSVQRLRKELVQAIGETELPDYPRNILKYSRNIEISKVLTIPYFNKTFGGSIESNIIYNPEAMMPKSLMLKYAVNAMGKNWELIETGLDVQGFEVILESVFGPAGYFPSNMMQTMFRKADEMIVSKVRDATTWSWLASVVDRILNNTSSNLSPAGSKPTKDRSSNVAKTLQQMPVPQPMPEIMLDSDIQENLDNMHDVVNKEQKERLAAIYLRVLGNELGYLTLDDLRSLIPVIDKQMLVDMMTEIGSKLTEGVDLNTTRSILFLERELVLPTGLGLPLNCSSNGSVVLSVRTRGQLSIQLPSATVSGRLAPSAAVEIVGTMGIHIPTTKIHAGVMANATAYHSSNIEGNVTIDGTKLKVQLKALEKPMNLLNFSTNYFLLKPDGEMSFIPGIMEDAVKYERCVSSGKLLGASLCMSFAYPNASYVEIAPRFPLTGPLSFNITLNNIDQTLGAYTFEAEYKQLVKTGAKPSKTPKKSFGSIGKTTAFVAPEEVIDIVTLNFTAPGDSIRRDVMTVLSFNRNTTEAKWTFDIPELEGLNIFAGLLNMGDKITGETGMQLVWNATYNETKSSVSFTLKNSTVVGKTNYTGVFNASVGKLHFSSVMQQLKTDSFMIMSMNETYYWDDETPIYEQLTWPVSGYSIKPEKYRTSVALVKSLTDGPRTDATLFISSLGQNLTVESVSMTLPESYMNEITSKFENCYTDLPLLDFSYQYDRADRSGMRETYRYVDVHRGDYSVFYQEDGEKEIASNTMSRNFTFGVKATQKVLKKEFADIGNDVLDKYGEEKYDIKPVNLNTTLHFYFNNETAISPSYFTSLNLTASVPKSMDLTDQTRWGVGFTARLVEELSTPEKIFGYVLQLNNTLPFLLLDFTNEVRISKTLSEGVMVDFSHETLERKYGKHMNIDMFNLINFNTMSLKNGFNYTSPYFNYSGGFSAMMNDINGLVINNQMVQNGGVIPDITDYLTDYYFTMKMWQNSSIGFHLTHKLINVSTDHLIHLDGPVTDFTLAMVPFFMRDLVNKTYHSEFDAIKTALLEVSYKITNSSLMVSNDLYVDTPYIMNVTMDHDIFLDMNRVNHSLILLMKRPSVNLNLNHSIIGPDDSGAFTINTLVDGNMGTFSELSTTVIGRAKYGKSLNSNLVMSSTITTPKIANITMGGNFIIKGMKTLTKFDAVELNLDQEVNSILGYSSFIGMAKFDTFKRLFKFVKSEVGIKQVIESRFLNLTSMSGIEASGFYDYMEFDRLNTSMMINVTSQLMSLTYDSSSEVTGVEDILIAGNMKTTNNYHLDSVIGNADYNFGFDISEISSPLDFQKLNGSSDFQITSRMMNVTTSNKLDFNGVRSIFNFDKVNGSMNWDVISVLGNSHLSQKYELNNFQNLTTFDNVIADMKYAMSSEYVGAAHLTQHYGIYNSQGLLTFGEANSTIEGTITSRLLNTSLTSSGRIVEMKGLLHSNAILGQVNYSTISRLFNMSGSMSTDTEGMDGLFKFRHVINSLHHESSIPSSDMVMEITNEWISGNGFMRYQLSTNNLSMNLTTPIGSIRSIVSHISDHSEGLFQFELTSLKLENALTSRFVNMSSLGVMLAKGYESLVHFNEFTFTTESEMRLKMFDLYSTVGMTTSIINMNGIAFDSFYLEQNATSVCQYHDSVIMQKTSMTNMRGIFDFDSATSMGNLNIQSYYLNISNSMFTDMVGSRKFLDFDNLRHGSNTNFSLPFLVLNNSIGLEVEEMKTLTESAKIATGMTSSLKSKFLNIDSAVGYELLGQTALFEFDIISMGANMSLSTLVANMSMAVGSEMIESNGLFDYTIFKMGGSGFVNSTIVSTKAEAAIEIFNQSSLLKFTKAGLGVMTAITSKLANITMRTELEVLNHDKLLHFDLFSHNVTMSFVSKPETMEYNYQVTMKKSTGLFRSTLIDVMADGTNFGFINSTNNFRCTVVGNAGFGIYDSLHLSNVMDLTTKYLNATSNNVFEIATANGILTFQRGTGTSGTVITTPTGEVEVVGSLNMDDFHGFMNFTNMAMNGKLAAGKLLTGIAGAEFVNFQGPFTFERMNASSRLELNNVLVNYTGDMVIEVLNGKGLFKVSKALFTTGHDVTNALVNGKTLLHLEANDVEGLIKFSRAFLTSSQKITSLFANGTSLVHVEANNVESLTKLSKANATLAWDVMTSLMNSTSGSTLLISNVRSIFDFDLVSLISKTDIFSKPANVTTGLLYALEGVTGFMKFNQVKLDGNATAKTLLGNMDSINSIIITNMDGLVKLEQMNMDTSTTVSGSLGLVELSGGVLLRNLLNLTTFNLLTSQYDLKVSSKPINVTSNGMFHVEASRNIFDVSLLEGNIVHNISTPYTSTNMSSSLRLREMTTFNSFDEMNLISDIKMRTPLTDSLMVLSMAGESSWGNVVETLETTLVTPNGTVQVAQLLDYENAKVSITIPSYGYIHLHGHLNEFGDEMTIKLKHILEARTSEMVEDFSLFVKLNQSDVVYTNFSWNPEVIAELMNISTDALNRSINYSMTLMEQTKNSYENVKSLSFEKFEELNMTVNRIMQNPRLFLEDYVDLTRYDEIRDRLMEIVKLTQENPKEALKNLYDIIKASTEQAVNVTVVFYGQLDEKYMLQEKIDKMNKTIQVIIFNITHPNVTWELMKPKLEEMLATMKESIKYDLIKNTFKEIVDIEKLNLAISEKLNEWNRENLMILLDEMKLLINTTKVTEAIDALKSVEINVGCVTFKDLANVDMETINSTYTMIKEFLMLDNLKQFINMSQVELLTMQVNNTLMKNLDLEAWNQTIRAYVDIPLLNDTMVELLSYIKQEVNVTLEDLKTKANVQVEEMKIRFEEFKVVVKDALQVLNETLIEVSGMDWEEFKEKVSDLALQFNQTVFEKVDTARIQEILEQLKQNVTSRINMTKIDLAIERLNITLQVILSATKNETHPINFLSVKYFDTTIFDFVNTIVLDFINTNLVNATDVYGEKVFELTKEYGLITIKLYQNYSVKALELYECYSNITMEKSMELYENVTRLYDIYSMKMNEFAKNVSEIALNKTEEWKVLMTDYIEKANQTVQEMYEKYYPIVSEFVSNNTEKGMIIVRNITTLLVEKSKPYAVKALDLLKTYKNDLLLQSSDVCINITTFIDATVERLPEYQEFMLNLTAKYTELSKEFGQELMKNATIYANRTLDFTSEKLNLLNEWRLETLEQIIEITKNEENLLNYYPVEWTGKTVNVLGQETWETVKVTMEEQLEQLNLTVQEKLHKLIEILADKTHSLNKYPIELLGMTVFDIYEDIKENVTILIEQGKEYFEVAKIFVNESIITLNETLNGYNITSERLNDTVVELMSLLNETLINLTNWIELAKDQPLNVTIQQIVDFANKTALSALELGNQTLINTVDIANKSLIFSIELWNNLTSQENLDKIPIYVDTVVTFLNSTIIQVNATLQDTILLTKKAIDYLKEEMGLVQRLEDYKEKMEALRVNVSRYLEETRTTVMEGLQQAKDTVVSRSTGYVEYLNNTLPGWMYRYYKVEALPFQLWNYTSVKGTETFLELSNSTKVFVEEFVSRFVNFNIDSNSLTVHFSHPFNWTSFRSLPTLTDAQIEALVLTKDEIMTRLILPSKYQIERLAELIKSRYEELMTYITSQIEENRPKIEQKLSDLRMKIKETRLKIEEMRAEFNWTEFKENVTMKYEEAREYVNEKYPVLIQELKANVTRAIEEIKVNYPIYLAKVEEITNTITEQLKQYQNELPQTVTELLEIISAMTMDMYLPTDLSPLIKPWAYTGMIFGDAHVMTFDGHVYEFPAYPDADCTYVLARDFDDGKFTLLVKELSTTLVVDSCTVTIDDKGLFFINGNPEPQSPPYVSSNRDVIVTRDGPWIDVTTTYGIQLNCHEDNFMCLYTLSGWYSSKTQGLLGNLDKEHYNDFMKPDGTIAAHLNDFANSYEVSGLSVCQIPLVEVEPEEPSCITADSKKAECEALFNQESSYLMPIFDTINPQPFLVACKENAEKCKHVDMVNPYINLARFEGVFVDIPGCADPALTGDCTYPRPSVTTADIVFIISVHWDMTKDISANGLKMNLKNLYVSIRNNYPNSNFALVAYGGSEYDHCAPHLHSNELEFFTNDNFGHVVDSLDFCIDQESCPCSPRKGDALQALKYATQLHLRDNAGKIFILINADDEKEYLETERLEAANILSNNGITLNVISDYKLFEKTIGKVPIIGVNYDGRVLYNKRNSAESITEVLGTPKGAYAKLAKATDGAMMHIKYLRDERTTDDMKIVMKKLLRLQLVEYSHKTIVCKSVRDYYGRPSSLCAEI